MGPSASYEYNRSQITHCFGTREFELMAFVSSRRHSKYSWIPSVSCSVLTCHLNNNREQSKRHSICPCIMRTVSRQCVWKSLPRRFDLWRRNHKHKNTHYSKNGNSMRKNLPYHIENKNLYTQWRNENKNPNVHKQQLKIELSILMRIHGHDYRLLTYHLVTFPDWMSDHYSTATPMQLKQI